MIIVTKQKKEERMSQHRKNFRENYGIELTELCCDISQLFHDKNKEKFKESLSRQSSKKNAKPHCCDKLTTKVEDIGATYMSRHFTNLSRQLLLENNINNCRDKATTEPDDKEDASMSRHCHDYHDNVPS